MPNPLAQIRRLREHAEESQPCSAQVSAVPVRDPAGPPPPAPDGEHTTAFDAVDCLDERVRRSSRIDGCERDLAHIAVLGTERNVHVALGRRAIRIGRAISADLHISEQSVSRRHALLIAHGAGHRILDDRSFN